MNRIGGFSSERAGIEVAVGPESYSIGRFVQLSDPERNAMQLWEPSDNTFYLSEPG